MCSRSSPEPAPPTPSDGARPVVVAIGGGSATGKSTLARALAAALPELRPVILLQDRYFRDFAEYPAAEREEARTANHPDAVHWPAFHAALEALAVGGRVVEPAPGTARAARGEPGRPVGPTGLLLIEGLFALWDARCRDLADLRLYTEVADDERVLRRIERDIAERDGDLARVIAWFRRDVQPNHPAYTAATRRHADLVIPTDRPNAVAIRALTDAIRALALSPGAGG